MTKISLGGALNAASAGLSPIANVMMLFGRPPEQWDITEGSFEGIKFHVLLGKDSRTTWDGALGRVSDRGGRRKVKLMFPYRDGITTDDLGRMGESFELDIILFGNDYKNGVQKLMNELQKPTPGNLIHPVRGSIRCTMETYEMIHAHDATKAVNIRLVMIEHAFTLSEIQTLSNLKIDSISAGISKCLQSFAAIASAIAAVQASINLTTSIKTLLTGALTTYRGFYADALAGINRLLNPNGQKDFPVLVPVTEGGARASARSSSSVAGTNSTIISNTYRTAISPDDPYAKVPTSLLTGQTQSAIAAQGLTRQVNSARAQLEMVLRELSESGSGENGLKVSADGKAILAGEDKSGSLDFYDTIVDLKQTSIDLQKALEIGLASSRTRIIEYTTPRIMSIREVAFANGVSVNTVNDIDLLNPSLLSVNYIPEGVTLLVPA